MKNIILIGSNGFIGSQLRGKLSDHNFSCFDLPNFDINEININLSEFDKFKNNDVILINAAGIMDAKKSRENPDIFYNTNGYSLMNIKKIAEYINPRLFIHLSSETVFGKGDKPFSNYDPRVPIHPYGISKLIAELIIDKEFKEINKIILRLPIIVGNNQNFDNPISIFCNEVKQHGRITIFNRGLHKRNFMLIDDVISSIDQIINKSDQTVLFTKENYFNLSGSIYSMIEIADFLKNKYDSKIIDTISDNQAFSLFSDSSSFDNYFPIKKVTNLENLISQFI